MKKFTFMLLTAFIAVAAMAAGPEKRGMQVLNTNAVVTNSVKQVAPKAKAVKVQAPVFDIKRMTQKAKSGFKKAPKKVGIEDMLTVDWMLCSDYYEYDSEAGGLVTATPAAGGTPVTFTMEGETISINGFTSDATEAIQGTVTIPTDEEMLAAGIIAVVSIPDGQTLFVNDTYGPVLLKNCSAEEGTPINAYVYSDGFIVFDALWADILGGDGQYAGYQWSGLYYSSFAQPVNGTMAWSDTTVPVVLYQNPEDPKYVTLYNFGGYETAVDITMKDGNAFVIESQFIESAGSTYGDFYTYATDGSSVSPTITGTGTENTLTFDGGWTLYSSVGYWYGYKDPATITLLQGEFIYPVIEDVAAVPAIPEILRVNNYDAEQGYGSVAFTVPTTDMEGNDIKEESLYYQLFSDIEGDIQPIVFTPEICEKLTEDMTIIPYTFTDNWDFADKGSYKVVFLNYNFNTMYDRIGVKSIYTGGGETNESEIAWADVEKAEPVGPVEVTFDFNAMDVATSSNVTSDGDINETVEFTAGNVTLAISPKEEGKNTPNRFWGTNAGPQLRVYSGTLTFTVPKEYLITGIQFNHNGKWGANTVNEIEIPNDTENNVATWTPAEGEELTSEVVVAIAANSQINSIVVTVDEAPEAPEDAIDPDGLTYNFDDGTLQGWTSIDADGDGNDWVLGSEVGGIYLAEGSTLEGYNDSEDCVVSGSYSNVSGALTPDNYLVSPKIKLGSQFKFFACAQDASYPEEHFGVFVSTTGKKVEDFAPVEEWTLKAVRHTPRANGPRKARGTWYEYTIDMSTFEGEEGYVAIRHFDCTDMFLMVVDDITFGTPAFEITPAEGVVESLGEFQIVFNKYEVELAEGAVATLTNTTTEAAQQTSEFTQAGNTLSFLFEETTEPGEYTLTVEGVQTTGGEPVDLSFAYAIEEQIVPVVAPEGLETETWYLSCDSYNGKIRANELQVGVDGTDMYIQGLCEYLPEAWVKGTVDGNTVTFASGQFYGLYNDQYKLFFVGYTPETEEITDVVFTLDEEGKTMTTDQYIVLNGKADELDMYDYYSDVVISSEMPEVPEAVVAPEDLVTENYQFKGFDTYYEEEVISEAKIGFYGEDQVYFQGLSSYVPEAWVVGTIEDGVVTIPETYMGIFSGYFGDSEVFFSGTSFVYDAEAGTFTSEEGFVTYENPDDEYMMDEYVDVVLTKINDVAATPADPVITGIKTVGTSYPKVTFSIPLEDVDGNPLIQDKLYYQIFIEKEGEVTPVTFTTDLYEEIEEEMTVIPYGFSDGWDFYTGTVYLNQGAEEIATWTKIGIQTIYYGGGEVNKSNIVWQFLDTPVTVSEALYATYVAPCDVDFTDSEVEAFTAVVNEVTGCVSLLPVTTVPAGTAVVVKAAEAGTYATYKTTDAVLGAENELVAATEDVVADGTQFVLAKVDDVVGFYQVTTGTTVAAGKGYMTISSAVKAFYPIEGDDATGIFSINAGKNEVIYNLAGQRINKAQKGVNIINGKKILK